MANRYTKYEDLGEGKYIPANTLGKHYCTIQISGNKKIVTSYDGSRKIILLPGDTLGYNCGKVWRVPSPSEYKDPIKRFLVERKLSSKLVKYVEELPPDIDPEFVDNSYGCPVSVHGMSRYNKKWYSVQKKYSDKINNRGAHHIVAIFVLNGTPKNKVLDLLKELFVNLYI